MTTAKACILYFSQSGNTERVAFVLAGRLREEGMDAMALGLGEAAEFPEAHGDAGLVGVGFPTFYGYPPPPVVRFLEGLRGEGRSAFAFTTYGGCTAGDSLYDAAVALAAGGFKIVGGLKSEAADSHPQGLRLRVNEGRPDGADLARCEEFASLAAEAYRGNRCIDPAALASPNPFFAKRRAEPRKVTVDSLRKRVEGRVAFKAESCLFCESCRKSCPSKSIASGDPYPEFSWQCMDGLRCYQCVRVCPGQALVFEPRASDRDYLMLLQGIADAPEEKSRAYIVA